MTPRVRAASAVLAAAALFGTTGTTLQLLAPDAPGPAVAGMRLLVGSVGLIAFVSWRGHGHDLMLLWRRPMVWVMGVAVAGYQAFFFVGTTRTGVAVATLIALGFAPILAGLLGWAAREGAPGWTWAASTAVAIAGLALLMTGSLSTGDGPGMAFSAGAGACYAVYTVLGVRLSRDAHPPSAVLGASFAVGAVILLPFTLTSTWWMSATGLLEVLWLGLVTTTVGYLLFGVGLRILQPGHIATLTLLEPAVATLLSVLVLSEPLSVVGWLGCLLIIGALALLGLAESRPDRAPSSSGVAT